MSQTPIVKSIRSKKLVIGHWILIGYWVLAIGISPLFAQEKDLEFTLDVNSNTTLFLKFLSPILI